jgi:hypothetical protein
MSRVPYRGDYAAESEMPVCSYQVLLPCCRKHSTYQPAGNERIVHQSGAHGTAGSQGYQHVPGPGNGLAVVQPGIVYVLVLLAGSV